MRAIVLLSAGLDKVSGRPAPVGGEIRAIGMGLTVADGLAGVHVGPVTAPGIREYGGYGLDRIVTLQAGDADPVDTVAAYIRSGTAFADGPVDLVLTARRASGAEDSGLFPYALAHALGWPVVADVIGIDAPRDTQDPDLLEVEQALPRGVRRQVRVQRPCVLSVHDMAPTVPPFAFARMRAATVCAQAVDVSAMPRADTADMNVQSRPYRARPRLIQAQAATAGGQVMVDPSPQDAAQAIVDHLVMLGVLSVNR